MKRLETNFAGLNLRNPFIVSSCSLTNSAKRIKEWEEAGAGAIVLKSLFEEEIEAEAAQVQEGSHTEELDYVKAYYRAHRLGEYLNLIKEAKAQCTIPIIASINCFRLTEWTEFAKQIEDAGADALELNIMSVNTEIFDEYGSFERMHIQIIDKVKQVVNIPIIVKLGKNLTNPMPLIHYLQVHGAEGIVLFNRMTTPDIHLETMTYTRGQILSNPSDLYESLRWIGLASDRVPKLTYAASGGVGDGASMVKALLVGASAVEVCSALYRQGTGAIRPMLTYLEEWMEKNNYEKISDFVGSMNASRSGGGVTFERSQFFKHFGKYE